ncbi:MAG: benzoate/H(+) symporter BenE family transporter [Actinomycetes bacterium]
MTIQLERGTTDLPILEAVKINLRNLPKSFTWGALLSGFLIVLISTTGPIAILFQAADAGNFTDRQLASWLLTVFIGSGVFGLVLTLRHGMPIIGAWAAATTALLVTGLTSHSYAEVLGAYVIASIALIIVGVTGLFGKLMALVPRPVVMAMLGGVLFRFGVEVFSSLKTDALLGIGMILMFFIGKRFKWRAPVVPALLVGLVIAYLEKELVNPNIKVAITAPLWVTPEFTLGSVLTLALPIFLLVMTTQNATGTAVLYNSGYEPPINNVVTVGGVISLLSAPFGNSGVNISAMTAAIATQKDADPNPKTRYFAGFACGIFYVILGLFGATVMGFFGTLPPVLLAVLAGLALIPVIGSCTNEALENPEYREAGLVALLITVSGVSAFNLGAPFWGLVGGVLVHEILTRKRK